MNSLCDDSADVAELPFDGGNNTTKFDATARPRWRACIMQELMQGEWLAFSGADRRKACSIKYGLLVMLGDIRLINATCEALHVGG